MVVSGKHGLGCCRSTSKHPIQQRGYVQLVFGSIVVIYHQCVQILVPAEFLHLSHIAVCRIQRRRYRAVPDADNNLADAVASEPMTHIRKVEGRE